MKKLFFILLFFLVCFLHGQENAIKKPEYVIIANDEIITKERVAEYEEQGYIKGMHKGVVEERREELFEKFGNKIGEKEFIIEIELRTEEEMLELIKSGVSLRCPSKKPQDDTVFFILRENDTAKDFTVQMINGETIKLSDLKGKVVLINFWATWCAPCLLEFYDFPSKIIEPFKNSGFVLLPISRGEKIDDVKSRMSKLKKDGIEFNVGIDPDESIFKMYAIGGIPKNILIDKNGIVRYTSFGYSEENMKKLSSMIKKILNE